MDYLFFLLWVLVHCVFQGVGPFHLHYQICGQRVVHIFLYCLLNGFERNSDVSSFISEISNLYFFSFFPWINLARGLLILFDLFKELALISLISVLIFIISLLLTLTLICPFSSFLKRCLGYWFEAFSNTCIQWCNFSLSSTFGFWGEI